MKRNTRKVLVVCSDLGRAPNTHLDCIGWLVTWARDATAAIAKVRHERFDLAALVSTGPEMDITETLFNLRDIRQSMPIAVVQSSDHFEDSSLSAAHLRTDRNLIAVRNLEDLVRLLQAHENSLVRRPLRERLQPLGGKLYE